MHHEAHLVFDAVKGLQGLPREWEILLETNGFTQEDLLAGSDEVLQVLYFQNQTLGYKGKPSTILAHAKPTALPDDLTEVKVEEIVNSTVSDPSDLYSVTLFLIRRSHDPLLRVPLELCTWDGRWQPIGRWL